MNAILKGIFSAIALFHFALAGGNAQSLPVSLNTGWKLQSAASVPSSGSAISLPGYNPAGWHNAIVPGTVLTSLVAAGLYPEPLYGENNRPNIIPESLCRTPWWYRTTFIVPGAYSGKRIWLKFEGINHRAEVWVNGSRLINSDPDLASGPSIQGAFMRGIFDITSLATAGSTVGLAVQILPPPHPGNPIEQTMQARRVLGGEMEQKDSPTFLAAAGWDWIPALRDRNSGIWQGVSLSASGPVLVTDPYVATTALTMSGTNATSATLQFQATLKNATTIAQSGTLQYTIAGQSFSQAVTLSGSASQTVSRTITVPNPALWWPNGYGAQNRYISNPLTFTINNVPSDTQNVEFGIRKVDWVQAAGSPAIFKCVVNGVPVMIRGGNWGMDEAMKRDTAARPLEQMVRLQKEAGLNMVRNWTGETTQESFYHWCDVYGLLVWNDFWVNGPDLIQMHPFLDNVEDTVRRYRHHPSIAIWCGRNEIYLGNLTFENTTPGLKSSVNALDPYRYYQFCSVDPGKGIDDNAGSWNSYGWEENSFYFRVPQDSMHTEMGAPSIPTVEAIRAMMPASDWNNYNDDWAQHDMSQNGYIGKLTERYGTVTDHIDLARKGQLANYECWRAMIEGKNHYMFSPTTGIMLWMTNCAQPSFIWQIYSYDLEPNASFFAVKKACEMLHIQMSPAGEVRVINHHPSSLSGLTARAQVFNLNGSMAGAAQTQSINAASNSVATAFNVNFSGATSPVRFVRLTLTNSSNAVVSDNTYWQSSAAGGTDCSSLRTMPATQINATATRQEWLGHTYLTVTLTNPTSNIALMTHLQVRRSDGSRVLPVFYSDNYLTLLPNESRSVSIDVISSYLNGSNPVIAVDGWNVTGPTWSGTNVSIAPNATIEPAGVPTIRNINSGIGFADGYASDTLASSGGFIAGVSLNDQAVTTNGIWMAAAPLLYRSWRFGDTTYTLPVTPGKTYSLLLHFAETEKSAVGERKFHIDINGARVATDFDIVAAAGGPNKAAVRLFPNLTPNASGNLVLHLGIGSAELPRINGLQVLGGAPTGTRIAFSSPAAPGNPFILPDSTNGYTLRAAAASGASQFDVIDAGGGYVALRSVATGYYVTCDPFQGNNLRASSATSINTWEKFLWQELGGREFALISAVSGKYVTCNAAGNRNLGAYSSTGPTAQERFRY